MTAAGAHTLIRPFQRTDGERVIQLWQACGLVVPQNNPNADIERKLLVDPELFLVACIQELLVGTAMAGYEGHRGWLNYVAVAPDFRNRGIGQKLVRAAEQLLLDRGCPKVNLQIRSQNASVRAFYESLGYSVDACISLGRRLIVDEPPGPE